MATTQLLSLEQVRGLFDLATQFRDSPHQALLEGRLLGTLFVQPSTRTRLSFEAAMLRLGGMATGFDELESTRAGDCFQESLEDITRIMGSVADIVVLRHPQNGAADRAIELLDVPVINAGDGTNEHPTQALSDIWIMEQALGGLSGRVIGLGGELNNRAYHSFLPLLALFDIAKIVLLPPPGGAVPERITAMLKQYEFDWEVCSTMTEFVSTADVVELVPMFLPDYNRAFSTEFEADDAAIPATHILNRSVLKKTQSSIPILHPGPRTAELSADLDKLPNFFFFRQVAWGVFMRMAVIYSILGDSADG
ncbi:MAG: hypothetical protein AAGI11_12285 [Pseudomonadota bacterium]